MISDLFIAVASFIINFVVNIFPISQGYPIEYTNAVTTLGGYIHLLDPIVNWGWLATDVAIVYASEISIFALKNLKWLLSHIPLFGGKGV